MAKQTEQRSFICKSCEDKYNQTFRKMILLICLLYIVPMTNATLAGRIKRFLTLTTRPVPTTTQSDIALLANSRVYNCPVKRDINSRILQMDTSLMREIYLREVGTWDQRLIAETLQEAKESFIDLIMVGDKNLGQLARRKQDILKDIGIQNHEGVFNISTNETHSFKNIASRTERYKQSTDGLMKLVNLRRNHRTKRSSDGSERTTDYCQPRGTLTGDGYMHMCSRCAFTTKLPTNTFPRYINEVGCDSSDCNCFTIQGVSHGKCKPRISIVKMLKKVTSGCRLIIHDGHHVISENWEIYDQPIQVGCECVIDKRSPFASYVVRT